MNDINDKNDLRIIFETEQKYIQEIKDFERYWYLGHRFQYNPFVGYTNAPFNSKSLNISKLGFREKDIPNKNISSKKRVALFGPSGLVGIPVSNDQNNISSFSNNYFKKNKLDFESLNFGVIAARIGNELKLISKILIEFDIDYVVLMSGFNDASSFTLGSLWEFQDISDIYQKGFDVNKNLDKPSFFLKNFWNSFLRKKEILKAGNLAEKNFRGAEKYFRSKRSKKIDSYIPTPLYSEGKKIYLSLLNQIISLCKFMNKPFLFILQPTLFTTKKQLSRYENAAYRKQNNFFGENEETKNFRINMFKEFYQDFGLDCNNLISKNDAKIIDIDEKLASLSENENVFYDESHYFEIGNKIIGEEISKFISMDNR
tara:strand:- start:3902 stop:5017 length:1116 start_codon:yes stop_codon:yes gene_type:complete